MVDQKKIRHAVSEIIEAIGEDPSREGMQDTPDRVARMYEEFFCGLTQDPAKILETSFRESHLEPVVLRDVPFYSLCEHHFLPFYGSAQICYIPVGRVVGLSKIARVLDVLAHRPQVQERLTNQLVDVIYDVLQPGGVAAVIEAEHMCMTLRGSAKRGSSVVTTASRGNLSPKGVMRDEFLSLLRGN